MRLAIPAKSMSQQPSPKSFFAVRLTHYMFYKSSILTAIFVLLSMSNAIAAELSNVESSIAEQPSELLVNAPNLQVATTKNSASIAKARLLKVPTTDIQAATELNISTDKNSASIAKARLRNLSTKESSTPNSLPTPRSAETQPAGTFGLRQPQASEWQVAQLSIAKSASTAIIEKTLKDQIKSAVHTIPAAASTNNQPELNNLPAIPSKSIEQRKIADASSELNTIEQWEINKSVTLTDLLLTPAPVQTIVQAPDRLPDSSIPSAVIETKKPESPKPSSQIIKAQKPETAPQDNEPKKWAVGVHAQFSTTGFVGVDAGYKFSPNLHARLGLNTVGFNVDYASQGIDYKARFNPTNVHLLGDFFPFGGGLRLTGGLVFQSNQFNATGTPNSLAIPSGIPTQINLGGNNFNISDVGTVSSEGSFSNSVAPYLGIGFGTPISPGLGFNFDAGVMFAGSPTVRLRANVPSSVPAAIQDQIRGSLAEQERRTNNDISSFGIFPVLSVGISYAF